MQRDYGQGHYKSAPQYVIPGSPDSRMYSKDMYDLKPTSSYGRKVNTKKNTTGTAEPNTGIQGNATSKTQVRYGTPSGTGRSHKQYYASKIGSPIDNRPVSGQKQDYVRRSR